MIDKAKIYGVIIIGVTWLELPLRICDLEGTRNSLWSSLCILWALIMTMLYCTHKSKFIIIVASLIWVLGVTEGSERWREYVAYSKYSNEPINISQYVIRNNSESHSMKQLKGQYLVLDFWHKYCSVCIKEFPKLQEFHEEFMDDSRVSVASVYIIYKENDSIETAQQIVKEKGFDFPLYSVHSNDSLLKAIEIDGVPLVLILDDSRNVIFRGSLKFAKRKLDDLLEAKI